jgi:RNA polymerase sigma-70 factor (ECF subfamily)
MSTHLCRRACRLAGNADEAADLVQETLLRAMQFAHRFTPGTNLRGWLLTILCNTHRNHRRREFRNPVWPDEEVVTRTAAPRIDPDAALTAANVRKDVRVALRTLPPVFREALWLHDVEERTYAEIAVRLMIPAGTAMSRVSRARRILRQRLSSQSHAAGHDPEVPQTPHHTIC